MSLFEILGALLIGPLKLIFEVIFSIAQGITNHPGLAIVVLSLAMNVLVLPLYRRADAIQEAARDKENEMKDTVAHIKATFSGDERMMILQAYYRQNNYNPLSVLSGSLSLMLEIPFFMAAYQFLSGVGAFEGLAFGPIRDLSIPDGLLTIGGFTVNVMPFVMTAINVLSSAMYLKGFPLKTKIQLYGMALFFLVFLYNAPSALLLYWTLNNTFSLFKTLYYKLPVAKKALPVLLGLAGGALAVLSFARQRQGEMLLMLALGVALQLPWVLPLLKKLPKKEKKEAPKPNTGLFIAGALFLTVLVGLLIPGTYIAASVQEYIDTVYFYNPVWYIVNALCLSAGFFLVWLGVFYWLANPKGKVLFSRLVWVASVVMLVNYMFFGTNMGVVTADLAYTEIFWFPMDQKLLNLAIVAVLAVGLFLLSVKFRKGLATVLALGTVAMACMGVINVVKTTTTAAETKLQLQSEAERMPEFTLSKEGNNVVVIMLDRAIGPFVPYIMEEVPQLREQFDGFTYYAQTLSYGGFTNFATPALYGGYEYTPVEMNLRSEETLAQKHNEALKVLPTLFGEKDYAVTVLDPSYANYKWIPDLSIYEGMKGVTAYSADGKFNDYESRIKTVSQRKRNFFLFSLMKTMPVVLQSPIYDQGQYRAVPGKSGSDTSEVRPAFMSAYNLLDNMQTMTRISEDGENTLMILRSNMTHEPVVLQEPSYTPASIVDNSAYYGEVKTITDGSSTLDLPGENQISHYHTNIAALQLLGKWFDYLRAEGVYDNTRIIVLSDHGRNMHLFDYDPELMHLIEFYQPLLLVKDFGAEGFETSQEFMTNADMPLLALDGLIEDPVNPFTGNAITDEKKLDEKQYVLVSMDWDVAVNNGNQFLPSEWATVSGDIRNKENWTFYTDLTTLPPDITP